MKFIILIIFFMCALVTVPYMFAEGGVFDVHVLELNDCGQYILKTGYYHDNVSFILIYSLMTTIALAAPFLNTQLKNVFKYISFSLSGWFCAGLVYEVMGLFVSDLIMQYTGEYRTYLKCLMAFTILIVGLQINRTWKQSISKN